MDDLTKQGIDAFRAGKRDEARKLLLTAVKKNPDSESAWGWLYNVAENDKDRVYCLKQVLRINPNNEKVNQLYQDLLNKQSQLKSSQPQAPKQVNQSVPTASQPLQKQPIQSNKSTNKKSNRLSLIVLGILASITICVCGFFAIGILFNSPSGTTAKTLSAAETFEVSAIDVVKDEGYTVTSAVCEVVSPEHDVISGVDLGKIVFHAFRITKPALGKEVVVLFASNHTAQDGSGLVFTVNSEAASLFPDFPNVSRRSEHPITVNTPGAQDALDCAQKAGSPPSLDMGSFDTEAWRRKAIEKFGPEQTYSDGSKDDYVRLALSICKQSDAERETMRTNLGADYEGSLQQYVIETFCPYVK
jgi:hypothetical protein